MDQSDVQQIATEILEKRERIVYAKRGMNGNLHQVACAFADEKMLHFEHFTEELHADLLWQKLIIGLAGLPTPHCAFFKFVTLISIPHFQSAEILEHIDEAKECYLHLKFAGTHTLSFKYDGEQACRHDHDVIRKLYGLDDRPAQLN